MKDCESYERWRQRVCFPPWEVHWDKDGQTQSWYIWRPSNKTHEVPNINEALSNAEMSARQSMKSILTNFLVSNRSAEYEKEIEELQKNVPQLGAHISLKVHFLCLHLDCFPNNYGDLSEEHVKHFHKDIRIMENFYQGRWDVNCLVDYC